jgi:hypothetical protein
LFSLQASQVSSWGSALFFVSFAPLRRAINFAADFFASFAVEFIVGDP